MGKKTNLLSLFVLLCCVPNTLQAQGLSFRNPGDHIDGRTSYEVFADECHTFQHQFLISFDMRIPRIDEVGYVLHLTDDEHALRYNIFYEGRGNDWFELNEEGKSTLLKVNFNRHALRDKGWFNFSLAFNLDKGEVTMSVDGHFTSVSVPRLPKAFSPRIVFGLKAYMIDVPSFAMRQLRIDSGEESWLFPLSHARGNDVYDAEDHRIGYVKNPYWLINDSYHWHRLVTLQARRNAGACYHQGRHELYYYTRDSLLIYDVDANTTRPLKFAKPCPVDINLGMNFLDVAHDRLYTYEVFKEGKAADEPSVASLDLHDYEWTVDGTDQLETQRHHHGMFFNPRRREFSVMGGFGSMEYFNKLHVYRMDGHHWTTVGNVAGTCTPRYFISLGADSACHHAYIFGGMGNESGSQSVGRRYYYDFFQIDVDRQTAEKKWELDWGDRQNVVPVRSLIVDGDYFYTMCYSEFLSDSYLHLYRFSMKDGSFEVLGDSIPIHSDRIATNANIYYDRVLQRFFVTVQEFSDDIASQVTLYSISLPALSVSQFEEASRLPRDYTWFFVGGAGLVLLVCAGWGFFWYRRRKRQFLVTYNETMEVKVSETRPNAIYLFGGFTAYDRKHRDISYLFTDRLRELTCLLFQYHNRGGISSKLLGTMLWGDKSTEKIKNSRSVIINHLRKVLDEIDGIALLYDNGYYQFVIEKPFYCDYLDCTGQLADGNYTEASLLGILRRGKFLNALSMPTLDQFKSETESLLSPVIQQLQKKTYQGGELKLTIYLAEVMSYIDPYNVEAFEYQVKSLKRLGKTYEAQDLSRRFHEEYVKAFGEDFRESSS